MSLGRAVLALCAATLVCGGSSAAARGGSPTTQELTITVSDGTKLACGLVLPDGSPPTGGWPGLLLFPGSDLGFHHTMEDLATADFAPAGFASLSCDARGTGASGGRFGLDGPTDVQDARDLFDWLAARPDVSDTEIGAFGVWLGGATVWNAAAAGVPFKAIVPEETWTSLSRALTPNGVVKTGLLDILTQLYPPSGWDSALAEARADLARGQVTPAAAQALAERSSRSKLHSIEVPALAVQSRQDSVFDLDQVTAAYRLLAGPKRLYVGDAGRAMPEIVAWFEAYLAGGPAVPGGVELAHTSLGTTTTFAGLPQTRTVSVNLPGTTTLTGQSVLRRSVRLPGGPLETFGGGSVTVRYSGASAWKHLVATVSVKGGTRPVTQGAAPIGAAAGVVKIPLMSEAALLPRGKRLVVALGAAPPGIFGGPAPTGTAITLGRVSLTLSLLEKAVSR